MLKHGFVYPKHGWITTWEICAQKKGVEFPHGRTNTLLVVDGDYGVVMLFQDSFAVIESIDIVLVHQDQFIGVECFEC